MEAWLWRQTRPPTMPEVRHEEDHLLRCIDHLLRYIILDVSCVYRNGIEKRYSIEVPTAPTKNVSCLYRTCIEQKVSRYCIERGISKITIHVRYTSIHFDTFMGKATPIHGEKGPIACGCGHVSTLTEAEKQPRKRAKIDAIRS